MEEMALGGFLGLACGDALGSAVEFCPRGRFRDLTDMRSGGGIMSGRILEKTQAFHMLLVSVSK